MSNKRRLSRLATKNNLDKKEKTFFKKYISIISLSVGAVIGLIIWLISFKCNDIHCIDHYYPIPYMGISAVISWIVGVSFVRK